MIDVSTAKMFDLSKKIKSQVRYLNEISSELYLWAKSHQNSDSEAVEIIKQQAWEIEHTTKALKKISLSMEKNASLCETISHKAFEIMDGVESVPGTEKSEKVKLNDFTEISRLLSDYKFDMG